MPISFPDSSEFGQTYLYPVKRKTEGYIVKIAEEIPAPDKNGRKNDQTDIKTDVESAKSVSSSNTSRMAHTPNRILAARGFSLQRKRRKDLAKPIFCTALRDFRNGKP